MGYLLGLLPYFILFMLHRFTVLRDLLTVFAVLVVFELWFDCCLEFVFVRCDFGFVLFALFDGFWILWGLFVLVL